MFRKRGEEKDGLCEASLDQSQAFYNPKKEKKNPKKKLKLKLSRLIFGEEKGGKNSRDALPVYWSTASPAE